MKKLLFSFTVLLYIMTLSPLVETTEVVRAIACLIIIQVLWIGGVFPLAFSSLLLMLLLSVHFFTYEETLSYFASEIVWLLFSTFILAGAFIESGLASRLSLKLLSLSKGSSRWLLFFSFVLMFILSLFIPSNVGKASLVSSVLDSIVKHLKMMGSVERLAKSLFVGLTLIVPISGAVVATGASSTLYAYGLLGDVMEGLDYVHWILYMGPPIIVFLLLLFLLFLLVFPPEQIEGAELERVIAQKIVALGHITCNEWKVLAILVLTVMLWMTGSMHGFSVSLVALFGAILTVLPFTGIWQWETAKKKIGWDLLLFFAATLMLSSMLIKTGAVKWFASQLINLLSIDSYFLVVLSLLLVTALLRLFFVNVLGFLTIMLPVTLAIGEAFPVHDPLYLSMGVFLMGIPGFVLITQSPIHLISYEYGYFTKRDLLQLGAGAFVIWLLVILASIYGYWMVIYS
ncbi:citrate:succinate antiporter [Sporosarcina sp. P34]|uniref:SLC13 family permease n=1 Tax=Sporosarcina sp. P34 TaxID=2048247 RepID=UPI000C1700B5|nr:SLC13 family permease [Sporosarcina sp. P34]PID14952.1 citrate:succinate antiporter [Sporosarcina sp. P34]